MREIPIRMINNSKAASVAGIADRMSDAKSFVAEIRPFTIVLKIVGLLPVSNAFREDVNDWKFKKLSLSTLWTVFLYIITGLTIVIIYGSRVNHFSTLFERVLGMETIILVCLQLKSMDHWVMFVKSIETFDVDYRRAYWEINKSKGLSNCGKLLGIWIICIMFTGLATRLFSCESVQVQIDKYSCIDVVPLSIFVRLQGLLVIEGIDFFYIAICIEIISRFRNLENSLKRRLLREHDLDSSQLDRTLETYRHLHGALARSVAQLSTVFGPRLFANIMFYMINALIHLYVVVYYEAFCPALKLIFILRLIMIFLAIILASDGIAKNAAAGVELLLEIPPTKLNQSVRYQLTMFLWQLKIMETNIVGAGIIKINKGLIGSCAMLFATYFIAVIQLSPEINGLLRNHFNMTNQRRI